MHDIVSNLMDRELVYIFERRLLLILICISEDRGRSHMVRREEGAAAGG